MNFKLIYLARRNPSIPLEDWPRAWRSHAIYASQFPVINATVRGLFYLSRIIEPTLDGAPFEPPGVSQDYDGVGIGSGPEPVRADLSPDDQAKIDADELRVFGAYSPSFSFHCKETLTHGGAAGNAAIIRFLSHKPESTPEAFLRHLNNGHAAIALRAADAAGTVTRYVHDALIAEAPPGYPFDAIVETWFGSTDDATRSFADRAFSPVVDDLSAFCDAARSVTLLTRVIHRWPRD
jgi:hypothetical protein